MLLLAVTIGSHRVIAQSVTVPLMPGWNWISCPLMDTLDFETALGSFTPVVGDMVKSQQGNATFRGEGLWRGTISKFYPGLGYKYYSNRTESVSVTFNMQQFASQVIVTTLEPADITATSSVVGGTVTIGDGNHIFARGVCWGMEEMPTLDGNHISLDAETGYFSEALTELTPNTTYYIRVYAVTDYGLSYGDEISFTTLDTSSIAPIGAINGLFSVNESQQVYFSQGNLQYQPSSNTWRFAEHQYDICDVGEIQYYISVYDTISGVFGPNYVSVSLDEYNAYIEEYNACLEQVVLDDWVICEYDYYMLADVSTHYTSSYSGWIDLFGWGTSGYNHGANCYQPWGTGFAEYDYYAYGSNTYSLFDQTGQADWGYNPINNGGNQENLWRTLTIAEWDYLLNTRTTISGIRYAKAQVFGVNGIVLLPDDWSESIYNLNNTNNSSANFSSNVISASQWITLESVGAVFLPAAGYRNSTFIFDNGDIGVYWSASADIENDFGAFEMFFVEGHGIGVGENLRLIGHSVRVVRDFE